MAAVLEIDPKLLVPYPDELVRPADASDYWMAVVTEELGWRVLAADATPAQRARAEAIWRPVSEDRPYRCSGPCHHGEACGNGTDGIASCTGRLMHADRYPGSLFGNTVWEDAYVCLTCDERRPRATDQHDSTARHISAGHLVIPSRRGRGRRSCGAPTPR